MVVIADCAVLLTYAATHLANECIPMTRKKKTRSLKRIHDVRTGSIKDFKREANNDRQPGKRVKGRRVLSAYEKHLQSLKQQKERAHQSSPANAKDNIENNDEHDND